MVKKIAWLIAVGIIVHVLEIGFGPTVGVTRAVAYLLCVPLLILYALSAAPFRLGGRLKGKQIPGVQNADAARPQDHVVRIAAIIYVGLYLSILFRVRPRTWDRFLDMFLSLSLMETFWLIAPILVLWWYRQQRPDRKYPVD